jgi:O-acetyl-ADP-ribose deacetylase (regulator of RNase III)
MGTKKENKCNHIKLEDYRSLINLDEKFHPKQNVLTNQAIYRTLSMMIMGYFQVNEPELIAQVNEFQELPDALSQRDMLYCILTLRSSKPIPSNILTYMDELLQNEMSDKKITNQKFLPTIDETHPSSKFNFKEKIKLWKGDITRLKSDAIVCSTNENLEGSYVPFHKCVDNAIHAAAGPQLRWDCSKIIELQGHPESIGCAKITRAYNLPSKYVIHTVGPVISDDPQANTNSIDFDLTKHLSSCYKSCLDLAVEKGDISDLAFCSISTGDSKFPKDLAAKTVLKTIETWLENNLDALNSIILNVFTDSDYFIYENLLVDWL